MCGNASESATAIEDTRARSRVTNCRVLPNEISIEVFDISSGEVPITLRLFTRMTGKHLKIVNSSRAIGVRAESAALEVKAPSDHARRPR